MLAAGDNRSGQLGLGHQNSQTNFVPGMLPTLTRQRSALPAAACPDRHTVFSVYFPKPIKRIACGAEFSMLLDIDGGSHVGMLVARPRLCLAKRGTTKSLTPHAPTSTLHLGNVHSCGHPDYGQLGHGTDGKYFVTASKLSFHWELSPRQIEKWVEKVSPPPCAVCARLGAAQSAEDFEKICL